MRKWIEYTIGIISALFILWCVVSFIEVGSKNLSENPTYWEGNIFVILTEIWGE